MKRNGIYCRVRSVIFALLTRKISSVSRKITSWFVLVYLISQLCPTLWGPMDCSPSASSVHGDSPGKNTGVGCMPSSKGSSQPRDRTQGLQGGFFTIWVAREAWFVLHLVSNLTWGGQSQRAFPEPKHIHHLPDGEERRQLGAWPCRLQHSTPAGRGRGRAMSPHSRRPLHRVGSRIESCSMASHSDCFSKGKKESFISRPQPLPSQIPRLILSTQCHRRRRLI